MLQVQTLSDVENIREIVGAWWQLLPKTEGNNLFLTPIWILTWLETLRQPPQLCFIAIFDGDDLVGLAPFYVDTVRIAGIATFRCLRIAADHNTSAEYQDILVQRDRADEVMMALCSALRTINFDYVWVPYCAEKSGAVARFEQLFASLDLRVRAQPLHYYAAELPENDDAIDTLFSSRLRNNLRRYERQLNECGEVTAMDLTSTNGPEAALETLFQLHAERWRARGESGAFVRNPTFAKFIRRVCKNLPESIRSLATCLYQGPDAIAIRFAFVYEDVAYEIQTGFDPEKNGAGVVAIKHAFELSRSASAVAYDFLAHDGGYKHRFASEHPGKRLFAGRAILPGLILRAGVWPTGSYLSFTGSNHS